MCVTVHASGQLFSSGIDWTRVGNSHLVQLYSDKSRLFGSVAEFLAGSLCEEKAGIAIATEEHLNGIEAALFSRGLDPLNLQRRGLYFPLDAAETLDRFMVHDRPDPKKFLEVVGSLVSRASISWGGVRAFGEMVALLWKEGNRSAAIELEALWNDLAKVYSFALFCAYPKDELVEDGNHAVQHICGAHSLVIH
jgi:hypothetical protein